MLVTLAMVISVMPALTLPARAYDAPPALAVIYDGEEKTDTCHQFGDFITSVSFAGVTNTSGTTPGWHIDYGRTAPQVDVMEVHKGKHILFQPHYRLHQR